MAQYKVANYVSFYKIDLIAQNHRLNIYIQFYWNFDYNLHASRAMLRVFYSEPDSHNGQT